MPPFHTIPLFVLATLAILVIPGPAVLYIIARSSAQGRKAGLVSVLGVHTGSLFHVFAATVGLSAVVAASTVVFSIVKAIGGLYLIFLGVRTIVRKPTEDGEVKVSPERSLRRLYVDGAIVNMMNPKVALFFLAFIPQFVSRSAPVWSQTLVFGMLFIVLGMCSDGLFAIAGARVGEAFRKRSVEKRQRSATVARYAEGGLLIGLGVLALAVPHRSTTD